jgi:large subunit ribosomal protein L20
MPRVKRGVNALKKRHKIMKLAKGFRGARHKKIKSAREAVMHSMAYAYRDRHNKKRDFRRLWIVRINAAARIGGMSYNRFMEGLKIGGVEVNRKMLAELAVTDAKAFAHFVELAKANLDKKIVKIAEKVNA